MGGKLFAFPRMPRAEYLEREAAVRACLDRVLSGEYRIPRAFGDKPDFGDMDVIVADRPDREAVRAEIARALGITEARTAGHVWSTALRGLQTDFFTVPERYLESTYAFMCFNDLGNFIGRIGRRFDLKYGERGLAYVYRRASGNYRADLEITLDFARICAFLGLDYDAWAAGFPTLEAVFEWVIASPWFSVAPYLDEGRGTLRRRANERSTVARFIEHLIASGVTKRPCFEERSAYLPVIIAAFPEARLDARIEREREAEARQVRLDAKFSGKRVMRLMPGLDGKALGELIRRFKASFEDFEGWLLEAGEDEIDQRVLAFAENAKYD